MLDDLDSGEEIGKLTARLLREASCDGRLPTPVNDIIAAAEMTQASDDLFAEEALRGYPEHLAATIRGLRGRVSAALDRKEKVIYVDGSVDHDGRRRFIQLHEVTHGILPWQQATIFTDNSSTLSWGTRKLFEQEANQGSAELLFQRGRFGEMAADYRVGFGGIIELAHQFGASYHASFRRYVEWHRAPLAGVVLERSPCAPGNVYRRKEAVHSRSWTERYEPPASWPTQLAPVPYAFVTDINRLGGDLPLSATMDYPDLNNEATTLNVEMWSNSYYAFVLLWVPRREQFKRRRIILPASSAA